MDIEKFREQWNEREYANSFPELKRESPLEIIRRMKQTRLLAERRRKIRRMIMKAALAAVIALAIYQQFYSNSVEAPLQTIGFILMMVAIEGLNLLDRVREKDEQAKIWLPIKEFLQDEYRRMNHLVRLDERASLLLCVGTASVGMCAAPFLSTWLQFACFAVIVAAIVVIQRYDRRKISNLKLMRDDVAAQLKELS
jgi:hypothetical protein